MRPFTKPFGLPSTAGSPLTRHRNIALVVEARLRHPGVSFLYGRPLGTEHSLLSLAHRKLQAAGAGGLPLAVFGCGTSHPEANAEGCKIASLLAEFTGAPLVTAGFSGVTWPTVPEALVHLQRLRSPGGRLLLVHGHRSAGRAHPGPDPGLLRPHRRRRGRRRRFGVGDVIAEILAACHREALASDVRMSCDACAYRNPSRVWRTGLCNLSGSGTRVWPSSISTPHQPHAGACSRPRTWRSNAPHSTLNPIPGLGTRTSPRRGRPGARSSVRSVRSYRRPAAGTSGLSSSSSSVSREPAGVSSASSS